MSQLKREEIIYNDKKHANWLKMTLARHFDFYGGEEYFLKKKVFLSAVPVLISDIRERLLHQNVSLLLKSTDTLYEILTVICEEANLNYNEIASRYVDEVINTWIFSNCLANNLPTSIEMKRIVLENAKKLKRLKDDVGIFLDVINDFYNRPFGRVSATDKLALYVFNCVHYEDFEYKEIDNYINQVLIENFINQVWIKNLESLSQHNSTNHTSQLIRDDIKQAIKSYPHIFVKTILEKSPDMTKYCLEIFKELEVLTDNMTVENHQMHCRNVFVLYNDYPLHNFGVPWWFFEDRIKSVKDLILAMIPSQEDAYYVADIVREYPKLLKLIISSFELDLYQLMQKELTHSYCELTRLLKAYRPRTFDATQQNPETGRTLLHELIIKYNENKGSSEKNRIREKDIETVLHISNNSNALFVRDKENKIPVDYLSLPFIQKEMSWQQSKALMQGFNDPSSSFGEDFFKQIFPKEVLQLISFSIFKLLNQTLLETKAIESKQNLISKKI